MNKSHYEVSINISPIFRGKGMVQSFFLLVLVYLVAKLEIKVLYLLNKENNYRSSNLFISAGFLPCPSTKEGFHMYALEVSWLHSSPYNPPNEKEIKFLYFLLKIECFYKS